MLRAVGDCHIGIDVSKSRLDVAVHETGETFNCANNSNGFAKSIESLKKFSISKLSWRPVAVTRKTYCSHC